MRKASTAATMLLSSVRPPMGRLGRSAQARRGPIAAGSALWGAFRQHGAAQRGVASRAQALDRAAHNQGQAEQFAQPDVIASFTAQLPADVEQVTINAAMLPLGHNLRSMRGACAPATTLCMRA